MVNLLIFPAGSEVGLEIERSFRFIRNINVFGASSTPDHSSFEFDRLEYLPHVGDESFLIEFEKLTERLKIDYVFPAHDDVVLALSEWSHNRSGSVKPQIISSGYQTDAVARSKRSTYNLLENTVAVPTEYDPNKVPEISDIPLFIKPDRGQGSKGTRKIDAGEAVGQVSRDQLLLEFLPGREFTVDCFTDREGRLRFAQARERARTSNGISVSTKEVQFPAALHIASKINACLNFRGMWFFQLKLRSDGSPVLLEIATRVSGNMGYFRAKGVNLPLLALFDRMELDVDIFYNSLPLERDSALRASYKLSYDFNGVYIDLDDTLIFNQKVNASLIALLYQWRGDSKSLHLITRHRAVHGVDPRETLRLAKIDPELFESIIEIADGELKSSKIELKPSIFIDDSHKERSDVHFRSQIPTFDSQQAIEIFS